jgi:acetyl-CoA carboxylase carboxyltransferase component
MAPGKRDGASKKSSLINDPVYGQEQTAPGSAEPAEKGPGKGRPSAEEDPVYSQSPHKSSTTANDPVYAQPRSAPDAARLVEPSQGRGNIKGSDDPVYSQSREPRGKTVQDPVYGQSQTMPPTSGPADLQEGTGGPSAFEDPVYAQAQTFSKQQTINDPVYGQPQSSPPALQHASPSQGCGNIPPSDDPVYSQQQSARSPSPNSVKSQLQTQPSATQRLTQLTSQITPSQTESHPNTKRTRKPKNKSNNPSTSLPDDYSDILQHLTTLRHIAQTPDTTSRGYQRQLTSGKLWSRERISQLLDPNTWTEIGSVTGTVTWERDSKNHQSEHVRGFIPSNNPQGFGRVTCPRTGLKKEIYLTSDDFSIRAGHADGSVGIKTLYGEKLALELKVPVVKLVDGSSGGGSVSTIITQGYSYMPHVTILKPVVKQLNAGIPNIGAVLGPAIGLGAARVVATHFSVMAGDIGSLFNAGPKVVEGATFEEGLSFADLGGPGVHCTNGTIDNLAANEQECFEQIRTVLGYLPNCGALEAPPCVSCEDPVERADISLRSIIPRKKSRGYNAYTIITTVVDKGSWFEIGGQWGRTGIVGLARLGGRPVGILSLNCEVNSGALDALGSQKLMKMLKFCDVFNLPVLQFVDVRKLPLTSTTTYSRFSCEHEN